MNARKIFNLVMAFVFAVSLLGMPAPVAAQEPQPNPYIDVRANTDKVEALQWTMGDTLTLTITRPNTPDYTAIQTINGTDPRGSGQTYAFFDLSGNYDIQTGDQVNVSNGSITKTTIVTNLAINGVDMDADKVRGVAESDSRVDAWACESICAFRHVTADGNGTWFADFAHPGIESDEQDTLDIIWGSWVEAQQTDTDGDRTMFGEVAPRVVLVVDPKRNIVSIHNWAMGKTLSISIDAPGFVPPAPIIVNNDYVNFFLDFDIQPGQKVSVTDGEITASHIVRDFAITNVDPTNDTISGTTNDTIRQIDLIFLTETQNCNRTTAPNPDGTWNVNVSIAGPGEDVCHLKPGSAGEMRQVDINRFSTMEDWSVSNPNFIARLTENRVEASDWPQGTQLTLTIDDDTNPDNGVLYTQTAIADYPEDDPSATYADFELSGYYTLKRGDYVTVSGGGTTKTHKVVNVTITLVDIDHDIIRGTVDPTEASSLLVRVRPPGTADRRVTPDDQGNWVADFSQAGPNPGEEQPYDIGIGNNGVVRIDDEDGDATTEYWSVPASTLHAVPLHPEVHGHDWALGTDVTLYIDDDANLANGYLYTDTKGALDNTDGCGEPCFDLTNKFDLQVGQYVTFIDDNVTKMVYVSRLHITEVNPENETLRGIADPGSTVQVNIWSQDGISRTVQADQDGNWSVDFSVPGSGDNEAVTDIGPGDNGRAIQLNADDTDDGTLEYWTAQLPQCQLGNTVTGTVFEHNGSTPIPSAHLQIEDYNTGTIYCAGNVDQNGSFGFALPEGDYRILASEDNHTQEYYNEAHDTNAALLHVTTGSQLTNINFTLSLLPAMEHFTFNLANPLLQDPAVRRAIAFGTDRQRILNEAFVPNGIYGAVTNSIVPPEHWAAAPNSELTLYPYDPAQARTILDAAGWIDRDGDGIRENAQGVELAFTFKTTAAAFRVASSQIFRENMEQIGIRIDVFNIDAGTFFGEDGTLAQRDFDIAEFAWSGDYDDGAPYLGGYITGNEQNYAGYSNSVFDADIANAAAATNEADKIPYWVDAQAILTQDLPILPLFTRYSANLPTGTISGTVNDLNGNPITGYPIGVTVASTSDETLAQACTDPATGQYTIVNVPQGVQVKVYAGDTQCGSHPYGLEYWQHATYMMPPTLITLTDSAPDLTDIDFNLGMHIDDTEYYIFNFNNPILADPAVRQAIAFGTDRERILNEAFLPNGEFGGIVQNSYIPTGHWAKAPNSTLTLYPYDPDQARAILTTAGWIDTNGDGIREKNGQKLTLHFKTTPRPSRMAAGEIFKQEMAEIGIEVITEYIPAGTFFGSDGTINTGDFDIAEYTTGYCNSAEDETCLAYPMFLTGEPDNTGHYSNAEADTEYHAIENAATREEKLIHSIQHQAIITNDLAVFPLFTRGNTVEPTNTPAGNNVSVTPASWLAIHFDEISEGGVTSGAVTNYNPADLPGGFQLIGTVYEVGTSAWFTQAQVCFNYDDSALSPVEEANLKLYHQENLEWVDVTDAGYPNTSTNVICGTVDSFSPFAILLPLNQPPVANAGPDQTALEGDTVSFDASASHDPDGDALTYEWDLNNDGEYNDANGMTASFNFADNGNFTIGLKVTDPLGLSNIDTLTVTVNNVAPTITYITAPVAPIQMATNVNVSAAFTDPGADTFTAAWNWGDGSTTAGAVSGHNVTGSHFYATPGIYTLKLTVTDDDGGSTNLTYQYIVIYDPNGGFTTGGGWFIDPSSGNKANFGFNTKYQKDSSIPTGNTEFKVGNLNFKSTSYDWLVVSGAKAQFKGTGTINGSGDYAFLVTVIDGQVSGGGGYDLIRITIWNKATGAMVYDNQPGASDNASPTMRAEGGSITIHNK